MCLAIILFLHLEAILPEQIHQVQHNQVRARVYNHLSGFRPLLNKMKHMRIYKFPILFFALAATLFISCKKTDYLDINAGDRPALSAKVKFINARQSTLAVNFLDFTRKVTTTALQRNTASGYLYTQFGKVQFNLTE